MGFTPHSKSCALAAGVAAAVAASIFLIASPARAQEPIASDQDSFGSMWRDVTKESSLSEQVRVTDRIEYKASSSTFGTVMPRYGCNVAADDSPDMIFGDADQNTVHIVTYVPRGSTTDTLTRGIDDQEGRINLAAPQGSKGFGAQVECIPRKSGGNILAVLDEAGMVYFYQAPVTRDSKPVSFYRYDGSRPVTRIQSLATPTMPSALLAVATDGEVGVIDTSLDLEERLRSGNKAWHFADAEMAIITTPRTTVTLNPLGDIDGDKAADLGIGLPDQQVAYVHTALTPPRRDVTKAHTSISLKPGQKGAVGASMVGLGDLNDDGFGEVGVGIPATTSSGAIATILGSAKAASVVVNVDSDSGTPVTRGESERGGYLLVSRSRQAIIGQTLGLAAAEKSASVLVAGNPSSAGSTGALIFDAKSLLHDYITARRGLEDMHLTTYGRIVDKVPGSGAHVSILPHRTGDALSPVILGTHGRDAAVWTLDLRRLPYRSDTTPPGGDDSIPPQPKPIDIKPGLKTVDTPTRKIWLGEFTQGLGGAMARHAGDVTGDGIPDIIAGNVVRSEWKYDPFYKDTTETKGWVHNVTGQVQIIPGGTPGGALPQKGVISINGPKETGESGVDAVIGLSVAYLGDVNADGIGDFAFQSHTMGKVWVIYGGSKLDEINLDKGLESTQGFVISTSSLGSGGLFVDAAGDVNGDGLADIAFTHSNIALSQGLRQDQGAGYVIAGNSDGHAVSLADPLAESDDVLVRILSPRGNQATALSPVGDVNADGRADFVLADYTHASDVNVVTGRAWLLTGITAGARIDLNESFSGAVLNVAPQASARLGIGSSISAVGDVDSDGINDFVIGFDGGLLVNQSPAGVALIKGSRELPKMITINPSGTSDPLVSVLTSPESADGAGYAVDTLRRPGKPTLVLVGAQNAKKGAGAAYLFPAADFQGSQARSMRDNKQLVTIDSAGSDARFGRSVAFVGGFLDGRETLAVGGDAVIHSASDTGPEGAAHTAHILATVVPDQTDPTPPTSVPTPPTSVPTPPTSVPPAGHRPSMLPDSGA